MTIRRWIKLQPWVAAALFIIGLGNVWYLPYYSIGPGPATDVVSLVEVSGADTFPSDGRFLLTTASLSASNLTAFEYLWTFVDPNLETLPAEQVNPSGVSDREQVANNLAQMEESKLAARLAAFQELGRPVRKLAGARVLSVLSGTPAAMKIRKDDRIVRLGEYRIQRREDLPAAIDRYRPGDTVRIDLVRKGKPMTKNVELVSVPGAPQQPRLGVSFADAFKFPFVIDIDTQRIGGPSGGLVFALAIVELLGEEDLSRGRTIAATGQIIFEEGVAKIRAIGGIEEKVHGAHEVGTTLFIVPQANLADALAAAPDGMQIVGVSTFSEALKALRKR